MLIPIVCPKCATGYQVQDSLIGKAMRCPLVTCRHVMLVEAPPSPPKPSAPELRPSRPSQDSGSVGGLVPLLASTDPVTDIPLKPVEDPAPAPTPTPSWAAAPPPVRALPFDAEPPPVRKPADSSPRKVENLPMPVSDEEEPTPAAPRTRLAKWIIYPFLLLAVGGVSVGAWVVYSRLGAGENEIRAEADANYDKGLFDSAARLYEALESKWPSSDDIEYYRFRSAIAGLRARIAGEDPEPGPLLDNIEQLTKDHKGKPILGAHAHDLSAALSKLMEDFEARAEKHLDDASGPKTFARAEQVAKAVAAIKRKKQDKAPDLARIAAARAKLEAAVRVAQARQKFLANLRGLAAEPSYRSLVLAEAMLREEGPRFPGLADSPEVRAQLAAIRAGHKKAVTYMRGPGPSPGPVPPEEDEPALLLDVLLQGSPGTPPPDDGLVLALGRGVLYGQSAATGRVRWAMRVGIDTSALPVRVPAGVGSPERILVLSSDTAALHALGTDGNTLWSYRLGSPVLGRPLVVGQRAYLATYGGEVHEIELAEGKCLGRFKLGQPLSLGGVLDPATGRLYFAADEGCVYVLRPGANPGCEAILYSRHPAGSLRGAPLLVPGYLILTEAAGLRAVELKAFALPLEADSKPVPLSPRAELAGWTWFPAYHDPEKLVMLTDAGVLGIFGLKQKGLRDQALVPLLPEGGLRLASLTDSTATTPARAAVLQVQGDDLWLLGASRMQRLRQVWDSSQGPRMVPAWASPPELGSPLHRGQTFTDATGHGCLVAVTMPAGRSAIWSTCVDDEEGTVRWKRQLGLLCQGEPVPLAVDAGEPVWLTRDQGGALFALDPEVLATRRAAQWVPARLTTLAGSLEENPRLAPVVMRDAGGKSATIVSCPGGRNRLVLRRVAPSGEGRELETEERTVSLGDTLAGPPVQLGKWLLLPLADGTLARMPLQGKGDLETEINWRDSRLGREVPGFVVPLEGDRFVASNGGRGLTTWEWTAKNWRQLPHESDRPTLELTDRIVSAPVRVPGNALRFAVADAAGGLSLVDAAPTGSLKQVRRYDLGGTVTAGPFVRSTKAGPRLGLIVDRTRLVWIDPGKARESWNWTDRGGPIVGLPHLVEGYIVVADQSGRYVVLDEVTGKEVGKGHRLSGSISPAASPVPFGKGRLLAPLTDGTLLLLGMDKLTKRK